MNVCTLILFLEIKLREMIKECPIRHVLVLMLNNELNPVDIGVLVVLLRTQNSELEQIYKLINNFGLGIHLLRQDIVVGTDATLGCFKQNLFNVHIMQYVHNFMLGYWAEINK